MRRLFILALVLFGGSPAWSHSEVDSRNRVSFRVEARREVANDWATARFSILAEGKDPAVVANSVNSQMTAALVKAKGTKDIEIRSGAYVGEIIPCSATNPII